MLKLIRVSWVVPPNYDLVGKELVNIFYEVLEFYTLTGMDLTGMQFLMQCNLLSLLFFVVGIVCLQDLKGDDCD